MFGDFLKVVNSADYYRVGCDLLLKTNELRLVYVDIPSGNSGDQRWWSIKADSYKMEKISTSSVLLALKWREKRVIDAREVYVGVGEKITYPRILRENEGTAADWIDSLKAVFKKGLYKKPAPAALPPIKGREVINMAKPSADESSGSSTGSDNLSPVISRRKKLVRQSSAQSLVPKNNKKKILTRQLSTDSIPARPRRVPVSRTAAEMSDSDEDRRLPELKTNGDNRRLPELRTSEEVISPPIIKKPVKAPEIKAPEIKKVLKPEIKKVVKPKLSEPESGALIIRKTDNKLVKHTKIIAPKILLNDWHARDNYPDSASTLMDGFRMILIKGPAGIGKTTLAKYLFQFDSTTRITPCLDSLNFKIILENPTAVSLDIINFLMITTNIKIIITARELALSLDKIGIPVRVINLTKEPYIPNQTVHQEIEFP